MRLRPARVLALLGAAMLAGCGAFSPYPTYPAIATPGQPTGSRVAVCYNGLTASPAEAQAEAQKECPAGTTAEAVDTDHALQYCPLLLPAHTTFACAPAK